MTKAACVIKKAVVACCLEKFYLQVMGAFVMHSNEKQTILL